AILSSGCFSATSAGKSCVPVARPAARGVNRNRTTALRRRVAILRRHGCANPQGSHLAAHVRQSCNTFSDCRPATSAVKISLSTWNSPQTLRKFNSRKAAVGHFQTGRSQAIHAQNRSLLVTLFVDVLRRNAGSNDRDR